MFGIKSKAPNKIQSSTSEPLEESLALISESLDQPGEIPWTPIIPGQRQKELAPYDELLEKTLAIIPKAQVEYFKPCRDRYLALLSLIAPQLKPGARVLDVGCAPGHMAIALTMMGCEVSGLDLNDLYLPKYPSQEWIERLSIKAVDIENNNLPFEDGTYDAVLFTEVLEHVAVRPPSELVAEFRRVLKPTGSLLLSVPNFANISQMLAFSRQRNVMWAPNIFYGSTDRHNREYVLGELRDLLAPVFPRVDYHMMNAFHNWNSTTVEEAHDLCRKAENKSLALPIFYNTLLALGHCDQ